MEQQEKRSFGKIGEVIGIAALILAFFVGNTIVSNRREQAYNRAIEAIVAGGYETGLSILESSLPSTYKEKDNLISLCRAKQALDAEDYDQARRLASRVFFRSATPSADRLNIRVNSILDACHEETERKAAEELAAYEAKVHSGLPFVGMPEKYVSSTLLGEYSDASGTAPRTRAAARPSGTFTTTNATARCISAFFVQAGKSPRCMTTATATPTTPVG